MAGLIAIYRWMIRLYPAGFRSEYGLLLERQLQDEIRDAETRSERLWIWLQAAVETLTNLPIQYGQELARDLRHSLRVHARRPLPTFLAILTLALALGAGSAVFSVVSAMLLRPLPFRDPSRLVWNFYPVGNASRSQFSAAVKNSTYASEGGLYSSGEGNIIVPGGSVRTRITFTSGGFFHVLGTPMEVGRGLQDEDDIPGDRAVISHALWQELYGGDPSVIGRDMQVNGWTYRVVGVAPPEFDYPKQTQVWLGAIFTPRLQDLTGALFMETVQRLKPGMSFEAARAAYDAVANPPERIRNDPASRYPFERLDDTLTRSREGFGLLLASVGFLVLIACANVAHMVLARVLERRKEIEIRAALGAHAGRLMQQLLAESVALSLAAGVAGLFVALVIVRLLRVFVPPETAAQTYTLLDWRVLMFAFAMALVTGLIFGIAPAWHAMRLRHGISRPARFRQMLISVQAALTLILLAAALSMMLGFVHLRGVDLGFQTHNVATLSVSPEGSKAGSDSQAAAYYRAALERLRALPGVEAASAINYLPLTPDPIMIVDYAAQGTNIGGMPVLAAADYFRTVGTTILVGREFTERDTADSEPVAVVNEPFARELTHGDPATAIGRTIRNHERNLRIVGVTRAGLYWGPKRTRTFNQVYTPLAQGKWPNMTFVVKVPTPQPGDLSRLKSALQGVEPTVAIYDAKWFSDRWNESVGKDTFYTLAGLSLAGCALIFAIAGIYGMAAHAVAQQSRDMAVRAALGARIGQLRFRVCARTLVFIAGGSAAGAAFAQASGSLILHWMENAAPIGTPLIAVAALLLVAVAAPALWLATAAIRRMDTSQLLRAE